MKSAEKTIIANAPSGVSDHDMGTGWRVIVARYGERAATWYYHVNDDPRIRKGILADAERRYARWADLYAPPFDPDRLREDRDERRRLDREDTP